MARNDQSCQGSRARRLLGRALVVTGAVAAGTGAVWALGTGPSAHASAPDAEHERGLLPGVQRDVDGLLDPAADSGAAPAAQHSAAQHSVAPHSAAEHSATARSAAQPGPEASPLPQLDPGSLLRWHGRPEKDVHRNVNHEDVRIEPAHQPAVDTSSQPGRADRSTADGQARPRTGASSASERPLADVHEDVVAPVAKTVRGPVLGPVAAPVTGAVDDVAHAVRPVLEPAGKAVAQVGEHPDQLPRTVDAGLTDLVSPLWTDAGVPPAPAPTAHTAPRPELRPAPVADHPAQSGTQPRTAETAAHRGKAPTAHPKIQHHQDLQDHQDHPKAPGHPKLDDLAVPGAPAPTPGPAFGGHLPGGDLGLDWCPRVPGPHLPSLGVLGHPRDDAATGTCGSQPGTTPD